jgi:hypothetical protein
VTSSETRTEAALATRDQLSAERLALRWIHEPEIIAVLDRERALAQQEPVLTRPQARERLEVALRAWALGLMLREIAGDAEAPKILWVGETTPRIWGGHTFPGAALAGDNPDAIYRHAFVDGDAVYELSGRLLPGEPGEFSVEPIPGVAGVIPQSGTLTGKIGVTSGPAMLTGRDLRRDGQDRFRLVLGGPPPPDGADHLPLAPGPMAINTRDVLSDWRQRPVPLSIRRLSPPRSPQLAEAELRLRVIEHLPGWVRHWRAFKDSWLGGLSPNSFKGPFGREGAWSYILAGRFALEPGEAAVIRARSGGAAYHGFQVADMWQVGFDNSRQIASRQTGQALAGADGAVTYVIAPEDPGVANWIDTAGCLDGRFLIRWQLFGPDFKPEGLMEGYEVMPRQTVAARTGLSAVSASARRDELQARAQAYAKRWLA